jgi:hypothetical protein
VLRYGDRVLPAKLWMDAKDDQLSVSHRGTSLLTNATLDVTPTFGITTRVDSSFLNDGAHTVFGRVIDDSNGFLERVTGLPTYNLELPKGVDLGRFPASARAPPRRATMLNETFFARPHSHSATRVYRNCIRQTAATGRKKRV